ERNAALPGDRIAALKRFHEAGVFTWLSLEPTIDVEASLSIVDVTHEFVDLYKVGRANYLPMTARTDWRDYSFACSISSPKSARVGTSSGTCSPTFRQAFQTRCACPSIIERAS